MSSLVDFSACQHITLVPLSTFLQCQPLDRATHPQPRRWLGPPGHLHPPLSAPPGEGGYGASTVLLAVHCSPLAASTGFSLGAMPGPSPCSPVLQTYWRYSKFLEYASHSSLQSSTPLSYLPGPFPPPSSLLPFLLTSLGFSSTSLY